MDSSRSGLLSTILMTLPLIVVPAVALLRPPGTPGVATVPLEAGEGETEDSFFDDFDAIDAEHLDVPGKNRADSSLEENDRDRSEVDRHQHGTAREGDIFGELESTAREIAGDSPNRPVSRPATHPDPFMDGPVSPAPPAKGVPESSSPDEVQIDTAKSETGEIISQMNALGALKTVWFEAGEKTPVGLAVFFRGAKENTRMRFESVGQSRNACAKDVLEQVTRWKKQNPEL